MNTKKQSAIDSIRAGMANAGAENSLIRQASDALTPVEGEALPHLWANSRTPPALQAEMAFAMANELDAGGMTIDKMGVENMGFLGKYAVATQLTSIAVQGQGRGEMKDVITGIFHTSMRKARRMFGRAGAYEGGEQESGF